MILKIVIFSQKKILEKNLISMIIILRVKIHGENQADTYFFLSLNDLIRLKTKNVIF